MRNLYTREEFALLRRRDYNYLTMRFTKMHGLGNDFIIFPIDEVEGMDLPELTRKVCDRHFGVGADGILVPVPSKVADLKMVYLNADGSSSAICGNGLRCLARYARDFRIVEGNTLTVETGAGIKKVVLHDDGSSRVDMGSPVFVSKAELHGYTFFRVSIGIPHSVAFLESEAEVEALDLKVVGPPIENNPLLNDPLLPERTNVEFAYPRGRREVRMRVWEYGAGETLACGSGSCATAVAAMRLGLAESPVRVILDGGSVKVEWKGEGEPVYMMGPTEYVCEGRLLL